MASTAPPKDWTVDEVCQFLDSLSLGHTAPAFKDNGVDGDDLLNLTDTEMQQDLNLTPLQIKKIRTALVAIDPSAAPPPDVPTSSTQPVQPVPQAAVIPTPTAPAAIGIPAPMHGGPTPAIPKTNLEAYRSIDTVIKDIENGNLEGQLVSAQQQANSIYAKLQATKQSVAAAEKAKEEAEKEKEKREGYYLGKFIRGKERANEKMESAEEALKAVEDRLAASQQRVKELTQQLEDAKRTADDLQRAAYELQGHRRQREEIVARIFAAPEWGVEPTMGGLRGTLAHLEAQLQENNGHAATYGRAGEALKNAASKISTALQRLRTTQFTGAMGMGRQMASPYRRPGGSLMMDMAEMAMVRQANDLVKSAANDIMAARSILPTLPPMTQALVKEAQVGVFAGFLLPGMGGNMMQIAMVRKSIKNVEQLFGETQDCMNWCKSNLMQFSSVVQQLKGQVGQKQSEVVAFQQDQLQRALAG